jgi:hypothetical protein
VDPRTGLDNMEKRKFFDIHYIPVNMPLFSADGLDAYMFQHMCAVFRFCF